jgi:hypothetical protein
VLLQAHFPALVAHLLARLTGVGFTGPVLLGIFFYNEWPVLDRSSPLSHPRFHLMPETQAAMRQCEESRLQRGMRWGCVLGPVGVDTERWRPSLPRSRRCRPLVVLKGRDGLAAPAEAVQAAMQKAGFGQRELDYGWLQTAHDGSSHYTRAAYAAGLRHACFLLAYTPWERPGYFVQEARAMDVPVLYVSHVRPDWWEEEGSHAEDSERTGAVVHLQGDIGSQFGQLNYSDPAARAAGRYSWPELQADGGALLARLILQFTAELPSMQPREFMLRHYSYAACAQRIAEQLRPLQIETQVSR